MNSMRHSGSVFGSYGWALVVILVHLIGLSL
jgi:hypothetical protein